MGIAELKNPENLWESGLSRCWEDPELGGYVLCEVLPARVESSLGLLMLGVSIPGRDIDGEGSV